MNEEAPTNVVGGGDIAGTGVGQDGEPPMGKKKNKYKRENEKDTKKMRSILSFNNFMKGK